MADDFDDVLAQVLGGTDLSQQQMEIAMQTVMSGLCAEEQIEQLLTGLHNKGETVDEVAGAAAVMRAHMHPIRSQRPQLLDTCGTGGGGSQVFNISTSAALVIAAAGVPVAKHGNRSVTSRSGSADVLAHLGVNIEASLPQVERCLEELGICFCFAPLMHPAMRHVAAVRRRLGIRTIFNILGPLSNPAGASHQLLGAGRPELRPLLASALGRLGVERAWVVSGSDGLGEMTISGVTRVTQIVRGREEECEFVPEDFGLSRSSLEELVVTDPAQSALKIRHVLSGAPGPARDIVVLNSAAGLMTFSADLDPATAADRAAAAIDSGRAARLLEQLAEVSHQATPPV
jgi:anthranilate phosphoribosyltransferase